MKKGDIVIITVTLFATVISFFAVFFGGTAGKTVVISQNNKVLKRISLSQNTTVELGSNTVEIKDGSVKMISADCKNQICVNHKKISKSGESIVCLPNKVIVEIEN